VPENLAALDERIERAMDGIWGFDDERVMAVWRALGSPD